MSLKYEPMSLKYEPSSQEYIDKRNRKYEDGFVGGMSRAKGQGGIFKVNPNLRTITLQKCESVPRI